MKNPWKEILIAFLIGMLVGWFAFSRISQDRTPAWKSGKMLERFSRELSLDPGQKQKIAQILEAKRAQFSALREEMSPRFDEIRASSKLEIRKVLTPEQEEKFEKIEARWEERLKKKRARWS